MLNRNDKARIDRYIHKTADTNDIIRLEELLSNGHKNCDLRDYLAEDWNNTPLTSISPETELRGLLDRIHQIIRNKENQKRQLFLQRATRIYYKVAAIFLLPLLVGGALTLAYFWKSTLTAKENPVFSEIYAPLGSRVSFNLPDGTVGWLNSGSRLTYQTPFKNNRKVSLEGEAWFDVTQDDNSPFLITAGNSLVKVLGTSFNVCAYQSDHYIEVILRQGKVEFYPGNLSQKVELAPSERLVFSDGHINCSTADPAKYKAWTEGKLAFRGDNMTEVARRIARWYNVKVVLTDPDLEKYSFRATFEDDSLEEVLRLLSMTSPIGYKKTPRIYKSDGTFEKEVITLLKKNHLNNKNEKN